MNKLIHNQDNKQKLFDKLKSVGASITDTSLPQLKNPSQQQYNEYRRIAYKIKYANDEEFRKKEIEKKKEYYYKHKYIKKLIKE